MKSIRNIAYRITNAENSATMLSIIGILLGLVPFLSDPSVWLKVPMYILAVATVLYAMATFIAKSAELDDLCKNEWISYHISRSRNTKDYRWIEGWIKFSEGSGVWNLRGTHQDKVSPYNKYKIIGMAKNGKLSLTEHNVGTNKIDDCFAYFPSLNNVGSKNELEDVILGFWFGPDHQDRLTIAPYILAKKSMSPDELNDLVANCKLVMRRSADDFAEDIQSEGVFST